MARKTKGSQSVTISLDGVLNADSIKGQYVLADEKATSKTMENLARYSELHVIDDRGVLALVDEKKRAIIAACGSCKSPFLVRTSDAHQVKGCCPTCRKGAKASFSRKAAPKAKAPRAKRSKGSKARKGHTATRGTSPSSRAE